MGVEGNTLHFYQIIRENPQILSISPPPPPPDIKQSTGGRGGGSPFTKQEILKFDGTEIMGNVIHV